MTATVRTTATAAAAATATAPASDAHGETTTAVTADTATTLATVATTTAATDTATVATNTLAQRLAAEQTLFLADRERHYLPGETRPRHVGEPVFLSGGSVGVLLVHGLMAAPEEVREWADDLNAHGYTVYAPRLAGHGTSAADLAQRRMEEWLDSVDRGHAILAEACNPLVIAGFSTGAALALAEAQRHPERYRAVISVSAPLRFASRKTALAEAASAMNRLLGALGLTHWRKDYVHNPADNPHINYLRCPIDGIVQIRRLMRQVARGLPGLALPALVMHGDHDPKVDVRGARLLFRQLGSTRKHYREIPSTIHGIVRGTTGQMVFAETAAFLAALGLAPVDGNQKGRNAPGARPVATNPADCAPRDHHD